MKKRGFTLAEVLITLAIVGVVAALTMPALITNIQDRVKTARIQNVSSTGYTYATLNPTKAAEYGFPDANSESFWVWSGRENTSYYAYARGFNSTLSRWNYSSRYRSDVLVLCKE